MNSRRTFLKSLGGLAGTLGSASVFSKNASATVSPGEKSKLTSNEINCDILIIGGSLGGVAAALAAARRGMKVILTEESDWIGGQATTQGVPLDEHPWIESFGRTKSYANFRRGVRHFYRRQYPLTSASRSDDQLNPGAGWVSKLCFEPRVGLAVLFEMMAPHLTAGRIRILTRHHPTSVALEGDFVRAVNVFDEGEGVERTLSGTFILDATELGDLLEMGNVESVIGAESRDLTGEPLALTGSADPMDQMVFTHVFALDYRPGEDHTIAKPKGYEFWLNEQSFRGDYPKFTLPDLFGIHQDHFGRAVDPGRYTASTGNFRRIMCRKNFEPGAFSSDVTVAIWHSNEYHLGVLCGVPDDKRQKHLEAARQLSLSNLYWLQTAAPNPGSGQVGYPGLRPRGDILGTSDGLAQKPYIRESRRIQAEFTVLEQHFRTDWPGNENGPVKYDDSVGLSGYRIDIHKPAASGQGSITEVAHGKHWLQQIPLGALIPIRVENLLPACKNLGVTHVTNGSFRVHPTEWNIGESAGTLAAFCIQHKLLPREVRKKRNHLKDFQRELEHQGVELDWPITETARSHYSHHNLELKDADSYYFGESWRLYDDSFPSYW